MHIFDLSSPVMKPSPGDSVSLQDRQLGLLLGFTRWLGFTTGWAIRLGSPVVKPSAPAACGPGSPPMVSPRSTFRCPLGSPVVKPSAKTEFLKNRDFVIWAIYIISQFDYNFIICWNCPKFPKTQKCFFSAVLMSFYLRFFHVVFFCFGDYDRPKISTNYFPT